MARPWLQRRNGYSVDNGQYMRRSTQRKRAGGWVRQQQRVGGTAHPSSPYFSLQPCTTTLRPGFAQASDSHSAAAASGRARGYYSIAAKVSGCAAAEADSTCVGVEDLLLRSSVQVMLTVRGRGCTQRLEHAEARRLAVRVCLGAVHIRENLSQNPDWQCRNRC